MTQEELFNGIDMMDVLTGGPDAKKFYSRVRELILLQDNCLEEGSINFNYDNNQYVSPAISVKNGIVSFQDIHRASEYMEADKRSEITFTNQDNVTYPVLLIFDPSGDPGFLIVHPQAQYDQTMKAEVEKFKDEVEKKMKVLQSMGQIRTTPEVSNIKNNL